MTARELDELVVGLEGVADDAVALAHAISLAERADLSVTAVRQVPGQPRAGMVHEALDDVERLVDDAAGRVSIHALEGERPADALVEFVAHRARSLLVMSTHARPALGQLIFGSIAFEVARRAAVPLVLVGPSVPPSSAVGLTELVICADGSDGAERAVAPAAVLADAVGLELRLARSVPADQVAGAQAELGRLAIERWPDRGVGIDVVQDDNASAGLVDLSHVRPQAVFAVATHARRVGQRFREGSVAACLVRGAVAPVLVVGPAVPD